MKPVPVEKSSEYERTCRSYNIFGGQTYAICHRPITDTILGIEPFT